MLWIICFITSIIILLSFLGFIIFSRMLINKTQKHIKTIRWSIAGFLLAAIVAFLPIYDSIFGSDNLGVFKTILLSIHNSFRLFVVDADYSFVIDNVSTLSADLAPFYSAYMSILFVVPPVLTFGFVISFIENLFETIKYWLKFGRPVYAFSKLNEKSLALAKSIMKNSGGGVIVFCDVLEKSEENSFDLLDEAKNLGAICFKKDIINIKFHSSRKGLYFFTIGEDFDENVSKALKLGEKYKSVANSQFSRER